MKHLADSIRFSLRQMMRTPANTLLCILVLAGCIALVASMFRLCYMSFLWKYPYENSARIVSLHRVDDRGAAKKIWSFNTLEHVIPNKDGLFSDFLPLFIDGTTIKADEMKTVCGYSYIDWDFCRKLGVKPMMGRSFTAEDSRPDAVPSVIISEHIWKTLYGASPEVIGKSLNVLGRDRIVVGVMPGFFDFPSNLETTRCNVWVPYNETVLSKDTGWVNFASLYAILAPGVSARKAAGRFSEIAKQAADAVPADNIGIVGGRIRKLDGGYMPDDVKTLIAATSACSLLLLLMGCGIVSGLLSARYSARMQELSIRSALGASRRQIVSLILVEFVMISGSSMIMGFLLDMLFERFVLAGYYRMFRLPSYMCNISGGWMFFFVASVMCTVTLLSSIMPALRASRADVSGVLRESTRTGSSLRITRLSNFVIATQVALACVVLCGGAIIGSELMKMQDDENYYDPSEYLCAQFLFDKTDFADNALRTRTCMNILDELRQNPEIEKVGLTTEAFGRNGPQWGSSVSVCIDGQNYASQNDIPKLLMRVVSPGYFASINVPIIKGRDFETSDDGKHQKVAAVTDKFAREYFGEGDPLGKSFSIWGKDGPKFTVVGVVPDIYNNRDEPGMKTGVFIPYADLQWEGVVIYLKGREKPEYYTQFLNDTIKSVDSRITVFRTQTIRQMRDEQGGAFFLKLILTFFIFFAVGALFMVAGGLYGVISLSVNMRRLEMGIRSALGADPMGLVVLLMRRGALYIATGLSVGALGVILLRYELARVFDGKLSDSWHAYSVALLILLSVSVVAVLVPASKGAYQDPSKALHEE